MLAGGGLQRLYLAKDDAVHWLERMAMKALVEWNVEMFAVCSCISSVSRGLVSRAPMRTDWQRPAHRSLAKAARKNDNKALRFSLNRFILSVDLPEFDRIRRISQFILLHIQSLHVIPVDSMVLNIHSAHKSWRRSQLNLLHCARNRKFKGKRNLKKNKKKPVYLRSNGNSQESMNSLFN